MSAGKDNSILFKRIPEDIYEEKDRKMIYIFTEERLSILDTIIFPEGYRCPVCNSEPIPVLNGSDLDGVLGEKLSWKTHGAQLKYTCPNKNCCMTFHYSISDWVRYSNMARKVREKERTK